MNESEGWPGGGGYDNPATKKTMWPKSGVWETGTSTRCLTSRSSRGDPKDKAGICEPVRFYQVTTGTGGVSKEQGPQISTGYLRQF